MPGIVSPQMATSATARPAAAPRGIGRTRAGAAAFLADPRRVLCLACAMLALIPCVDVLGDPDVWWHLRAGRWMLDHHAIPRAELFSYTAAGHPWTAHEWLSEVLFAGIAATAGLAVLALVAAAVAWSGLLACGLRARSRGAGPVAIGVALIVGARAAEPVLGTRPQVATFALACWTLLIVERHLRRGGRALWLLPPLFAVWANLHAGFLGGLAVLALVLAVELARPLLRRPATVPQRRVRDLALAFAGSTAACCLTPAGPGLLTFAIGVSAAERSRPIVEWRAPNFHDPAMAGLLVLLVSLAVLAVARWRDLDLRDGVLVAAGTAAALMAVRNTALCVALVLPTWTVLFDRAVVALERRHRGRATSGAVRPAAVVTGLAALVLAAITAAGVSSQRAARDAAGDAVAARYPAAAATAIASLPGQVRLFAPYADGGYLIDRLWPHAVVYVYGEDTVLGSSVLDDYLRIASGAGDAPSALSLLDKSGTNAVLAPPGPLANQLLASGRWRAASRDGERTLFLSR